MSLFNRISLLNNFGANNQLRACPFSGASGNSLQSLGSVAVTQPGSFSSDEFRLVYCRKADVVYLDPIPIEQDFETMYSMGQFGSSEYVDPERVDLMMEYYSGCINRHFKLCQFDQFRLLEVGAGMAWVSKALKSIKPESLTQGQDISPECVDVCEWVDHYFLGTVEEFSRQSQVRFQAISLTHVIEHLPDPVGTLKVLATMLDRDGVMLVTAPWRPKGWSPDQGLELWLDYSYLHVPAHITYFSETSLQMAARQAGLSLAFWDASMDDHQAFEAVLSPA